jgi:hypothetical protein
MSKIIIPHKDINKGFKHFRRDVIDSNPALHKMANKLSEQRELYNEIKNVHGPMTKSRLGKVFSDLKYGHTDHWSKGEARKAANSLGIHKFYKSEDMDGESQKDHENGSVDLKKDVSARNEMKDENMEKRSDLNEISSQERTAGHFSEIHPVHVGENDMPVQSAGENKHSQRSKNIWELLGKKRDINN